MNKKNIQVFLRVKPNVADVTDNTKLSVEDDKIIVIRDKIGNLLKFKFDTVLVNAETTKEIYNNDLKPLVETFFNGSSDGSILAYGETGSGKTFTMLGNENHEGVLDIILDNLKQLLSLKKHLSAEISLIEIYNEKIYDLLNDKVDKPELQMFDDGLGGVIIKDLKHLKIDEKITSKLIKTILQSRKTAATTKNSLSSRSHLIMEIKLKNVRINKIKSLKLVDLAGSEPSSATTGLNSKIRAEGQSINKSLLTLGKVINELSEKKSFVSFRDAKLTRILKHCLKNGDTAIIIHIKEDTSSESINTCNFGTRCMLVETTADENNEVNSEITKLHKEINNLKLIMDTKKQRLIELQSEFDAGTNEPDIAIAANSQDEPVVENSPEPTKKIAVINNLKSVLYNLLIAKVAKEKLKTFEKESSAYEEQIKIITSSKYYCWALIQKSEMMLKNITDVGDLHTMLLLCKEKVEKLG